MKRLYHLLPLACVLVLLTSACSNLEDASPRLVPQYGTAYDDFGGAVAATSAGQIYVLGSVSDIDDEIQIPIFSRSNLKRFDTSGRLVWSRNLSQDCSGGDDYCGSALYNVATDQNGNIYAAHGAQSDSYSDVNISKYTASGTRVWTREVVVSPSSPPLYVATATARSGETYVGYFDGEDQEQAQLVKYSASGQRLFSKLSVLENVRDAVVATDGALYLVADGKIAKYNSSGNLVWQHILRSPTGYAGEPNVAVLGSTIYVGHNTEDFPERNDFVLYRYTASGALTWKKTIRTPDVGRINDIATDPHGNVYLAGVDFVDPDGGADRYVRKLTSTGESAWTYKPVTPKVATGVSSIAVAKGQVYATGSSNGQINGTNYGGYDAFLLRINATPYKFIWER